MESVKTIKIQDPVLTQEIEDLKEYYKEFSKELKNIGKLISLKEMELKDSGKTIH